MANLCIACIICGEGVELTQNEELYVGHGHDIYKVCDECKNAVDYIKRHYKYTIEKEKEQNDI